MPLDLQPVEDSLDLQPVGEALDLRPVLSDSEQSQVANLKSEIARNLAESNRQSRRAQVLDYAAQLIDVPAALKAAINLPQRLTGQPDLPPLLSEDQARGLRESAADFYSRNFTSGTTPQPRFNLVSPDVQTQLAQGVGKGVDQLVSGLTAPENLAALAVAPRFPTQVGAIFAGQMLGEVPQSIEAIAEAQTPQEKATAAVGATANLALGGLTTGGLIKSKLRPAPREILDLRAAEHPTPELPSEFGGLTLEPALDLKPVPAESPSSSLSTPLSTIEQKYVAEDVAARRPIPAELTQRPTATGEPMALPEGYTLEGASYVYHEPVAAETETARMARENREAMEAMRQAKATEPEPPPEAAEDTSHPSPESSESHPPEPLTERPPDVLDFIESNYPNGVRPTSEPDFAEHVRSYRNTARRSEQDLLRLRTGERADRVLQEMHDQGQFLRLETEDQLLDAMHQAATQRNAHRAQEKAAKSKLDAWLDKAIDATNPITGDPFEGVTGAPVWLTKSLAHGALLTVREALKLGRTVARALQEGIDWLRSQNIPGWKEREASLWLSQAEGRDWLRDLRRQELDKPSRKAEPAPSGSPRTIPEPPAPPVEADRPAPPTPRAPLRQGELFQHTAERAIEAGRPFPADLSHEGKPADLPVQEELHRRIVALSEQADRARTLYRTQGKHASDMAEAVRLQTQIDELDRLRRFLAQSGLDEQIQSAKGRIKQAWQDLYKLGISPDHAAAYKFYEALFDMAKASAAKGLHSAEDLALSLGMKPLPILTAAWADAQTNSKRAPDQLTETMVRTLRQANVKEQVNPATSAPVKAAIAPDLEYQPRTHAALDQQAQALIDERGPDAAFELYRNRAQTLPGDLAERLKQQLIERARQEENQARVAGNANAEAQAQQRQVDLWTSDAYGTDVAQALAARQTFADMSAGAHLRHARETFAKAGDAKAEEILNPHVPNVLEELRAGHGEAIDALRQDESTNQTARAAVDHTISTSDTTHAAVVMELAGEWSQSSHILSTAREAVRAKANELLNIRPRPAGLTAPAHLRQILDDLAARAADIAASHYQGAEEGKTLTQKLQQRLGLTEDKAGALAKRLDEEFKKQVESAAKQLPKRIARQRVALGKNLPADAAEPIVDRAIREQLRQHNLQLGNLLEKTAAEVDQAGRTIGERIVADSGLTGEAANKLRDAINRRYEALRTEAQRRRLEALAKRIPLPGQLRRQFDKLLKWARLGAFDEKSLRDQLAQGMGIPSLTDEIAREIVRRSTEIDRTPEGFQRDRKSTELLNYIARTSGRKWWELPMAVWYANALSGPTTHLVNSISNLANLSSNVAITISRQPLATPQILAALARGGAKGLQEATAAMQTGQVPTEGFRKLQESRLLENIQLPGKLDYLLTPWRAVGRALAAEDLIFFKSAQEMRAAVAARSLARTEGLHGSSLTRRTFEILALDDGAVAVAKAQAAAEGLKGLDYRRRVSEIIEQSRPISLRQNAIDYALQVTFNQEPGGVAGRFARALTELNRQVPAARFVVPFVNIVVNVANEGLNYAPGIGAAKAIWGHWKGSMDGKPATAEALYDQWAKQVIGTTLLAGLAYAHAQGALQVTGSGPRTREQRDQLKETGWIPNSIKIGDRYYSFANAPAAIPLSILGNYLDAIKYKGLDQQDALNRSAYALQQSGHVLLQATPLDSLRTFFDLWNTDSPRRAGASLAQYTARTAGNFVIPNALRQIDRLFDPTVYDAPTVHAGLVSQVPFARRENRPAINVLGQPIRTLVEERFTKAETPDPLWRAIAEKGAWIPTPNRDVIVGEKARGPEYYRTLTPDEWYEYIRESGLLIRTYLDPVEIRTMEPEKAKAYVHRVAEEQRRKVLKTFSR